MSAREERKRLSQAVISSAFTHVRMVERRLERFASIVRDRGLTDHDKGQATTWLRWVVDDLDFFTSDRVWFWCAPLSLEPREVVAICETYRALAVRVVEPLAKIIGEPADVWLEEFNRVRGQV